MIKRISFFVVFLAIALLFSNLIFAEEILLKENNIPSLKRNFTSDNDKFTFAIIGDKTGGGQENWHIFDRAMQEINLLDPDFAMTVGDHIQGYTDDSPTMEKMWKEYMDHLSVLKIPVMLTPANHDISNKVMYEYWTKNVGKTYYSFDYKGNHFIVMNSEENQAPEGAEAVKKLVSFLVDDINKNKTAKHTFLFMHRPLWLEDKEMWKNVESALGNSKYTVFAGHYHQLTSDVINDHRYIILSATGAGLTEIPAPELGAFHHYTVVTVDGDDVNIGIIKPGSIMPETISTSDLHKKIESMLSVNSDMPVPSGVDTVKGSVSFVLNNKIEKPLGVKVKVIGINENLWKVNLQEAFIEALPNDEKRVNFEFSYRSESALALPKFAIEYYFDKQLIYKDEQRIEFVNAKSMRSIDSWMLGVVFDVPDAKGKDATKAEEIVYGYFPTKLPPEAGSATYFCNEASATSGYLDLDKFYEKADYALAYAQSYIYSPSDTMVWGMIKADDIVSVFINDKQVSPVYRLKEVGSVFNYFPVSLKSGWNQVIVKCADVSGSWGFNFGLEDPKSQYKFSAKKQ